MDLLAQTIFGHFSELPYSLNLTRRALKLKSKDLLTALEFNSGIVGTKYFWPFFRATLVEFKSAFVGTKYLLPFFGAT